jgi:pentatricopeptide repeat protein
MIQREALAPDHITFVGVLKGIGAIEEGDRVHAEILRRGLLDSVDDRSVVVLGTAIVDMYAKCGELRRAEQVLEELLVRDVVSWSALIAGFASRPGLAHQALRCFEQMRAEGLTPDSIVFASVLKACTGSGDLETGARVHDEILGLDLLRGGQKNAVLGATLVNMYAKLGAFPKAREVHEKLAENRSSVSWNALIAGYVRRGQDCKALACFGRMREEGFFPEPVTFVCILKACASTGDVGRGEALHEEIAKRGLLEEQENVILGTALVDMYAKCGELAKARQVLEELPIRDRVSWSALIAGYTQQEDQGREALASFEQMQNEGFLPDAVAFVCVLKACGSLGAVDKGKQVHDEVRSLGLVETNLILGTALVGMYARCGALTAAQRTLEELPIRDVACWNALMAGYAQRGELEAASSCLRRLQDEDDLSPNAITFQALLGACSRRGRPDEAQTYFESMTRSYGVVSDPEHQIRMVAASAGSGRFEKALALIEAMPSLHQFAAWMALLTACKKWGNMGLARLAYDNAIQSDAHASLQK